MVSILTSREPSPKIEVRMGVDNMVMMVKITATPSVLEEMRNSFVMEAPLKDDRYVWQIYRAGKELKRTNS